MLTFALCILGAASLSGIMATVGWAVCKWWTDRGPMEWHDDSS